MTETLTVTVLETATIFEGPDTVYRYDIMAAGIVEGWAVPATVDQVRQLSSLHWPEVEVIIDGDEKVTEMLTKTFISKGVTSYPVDTLREHPLPEVEPEPDTELAVTRPTRGGTRRHFYGIQPLHIALTTLFVGAVAGSWLLMGGGAAREAPTLTTTQMASQAAPAPPPTASQVAEASTSVGTTVLIGENFQVEMPFGYMLENQGDTQVATGPDPDIRIHIAIDPLHGTDPGLVRDEMSRMIADDPGLQPAAGSQWAGRDALDYLEDPGDGSAVNWVTWFEADHQISVGCHTRVEPTVVQQANCRSAVETLQFG